MARTSSSSTAVLRMVRSAVEAWALAVGTADRPWYLWRCLRMVPGTAVSWFMTRGFVRDERRVFLAQP